MSYVYLEFQAEEAANALRAMGKTRLVLPAWFCYVYGEGERGEQ